MIAVHITPGANPQLTEVADGKAWEALRAMFPDGFDGIRLGHQVIGYVGDSSLLDGSPHNAGALAVARAVYQARAGRSYHTDICGPMLILGISRGGESMSVPAWFLAEFLPALAGGEVA